MSKRAATAAGILIAGVGSVAIAFSAKGAGDYPNQVAPAVRALAHGDLSGFFASEPVYGSFSVLVRAPFAVLGYQSGGGELRVYRLGALACLVALGLLGVLLARLAAEREHGTLTCVGMPAIALLNPATTAAVQNGHPEELLAAALSVGALLVATRRRPVWAGVLLGLALSTKQWAVLAAVPVILTMQPGRRLRLALVTLAAALALTAPLAVANPHRFAGNAQAAQGATREVSRFSAWWILSSTERHTVSIGREAHSVTVHRLSRSLTGLGRPIAIGLALALGCLYVRRRPSRSADTLGLLALILLLRCVLDPNDNAYYHVPFLIALLSWEALTRPGLPVLTLMASAGLWATFEHVLLVQPVLNNVFYLSWTLALSVWIALSVFTRSFGSEASSRLVSRSRVAVPVA